QTLSGPGTGTGSSAAPVESGIRTRPGGLGGVDSVRALPNTDKEEAAHAAGISRRTIYRQLRNTGSSRPLPSPPRARASRRTCAFHLFVGSASRRAPQVFMMQSTDARHLHHSPLARQLHTARLGCVFTQ